MRKVSSHIFSLGSILIIEQSTNEEVNQSTAELRASGAVLERLRDWETSFTIMLTDIRALAIRLFSTECNTDHSDLNNAGL